MNNSLVKLALRFTIVVVVGLLIIVGSIKYMEYGESNVKNVWAVNSIVIDGIDSTNYFVNLFFMPTNRLNNPEINLPRIKNEKPIQIEYGTWKYNRNGFFSSEIIVVDNNIQKTFTGEYQFEITSYGNCKKCTFTSDRIKIHCTELNFKCGNPVKLKYSNDD